MISAQSGQINQRFSPTNIQFTEHGSTKIGIKSPFEENLLKNGTLVCECHSRL